LVRFALSEKWKKTKILQILLPIFVQQLRFRGLLFVTAQRGFLKVVIDLAAFKENTPSKNYLNNSKTRNLWSDVFHKDVEHLRKKQDFSRKRDPPFFSKTALIILGSRGF